MTHIFLFPPHGEISIDLLNAFREDIPGGDRIIRILENMTEVSLDRETPDSLKVIRDGVFGQLTSVALSCGLSTLAKESGIKPDLMIGHSLGFYSSLLASNCLPLEEGLALLRSHLEMVKKEEGGMAIVLNLPVEEVARGCREEPEVWISAYNCAKLCIVSGTTAGLERFDAWVDEQDATLRELPGYGPWHCPLTTPRIKEARDDLPNWNWQAPDTTLLVPIKSGIVLQNRKETLDALLEHMDAPVLWDSHWYKFLDDKNNRCVEMGLSGVFKKFLRGEPERQEQLLSTTAAGEFIELVRDQ